MARQHKIFVKGKISNLIFYEWKGIPCARAMPDRVRQSKATKASAAVFGKAVRCSKLLRAGLKDVLPDTNDRSVMYRLNNALLKWLLESKEDKHVLATGASSFAGFSFYEESALMARLRLLPVVDFSQPGTILINMPELLIGTHLIVPAHTQAIKWTFTAVSCNISELERVDVAPLSSTITYETTWEDGKVPARVIELPFTIKDDDLVLVAVKLVYMKSRSGRLSDVVEERWKVGGVVGGFFQPG